MRMKTGLLVLSQILKEKGFTLEERQPAEPDSAGRFCFFFGEWTLARDEDGRLYVKPGEFDPGDYFTKVQVDITVGGTPQLAVC